jgi:hypothetical protein
MNEMEYDETRSLQLVGMGVTSSPVALVKP